MCTVLIVDDERLIRKSIVSKLEKSSFEFERILEAGSGNDALRYSAVDILITDIRMGSPSGLELTRKMQEANPELKTIIISGYSEFSYAAEAISLGVIDYLVKPINTKELLDSVSKTMDLIHQERKDRASREKGVIEEASADLSVFFQNPPGSHGDDISRFLSLRRTACYLSIRLFVIGPNENLLYVVMDQIARSPFSPGHDIACFKDRLREVGLVIAFQDQHSAGSPLPEAVEKLISGISGVLEEKGMRNHSFGISEFARDPMEGYKQSLDALHHRIVFPEKRIISHEQSKGISENFLISKERRTEFLLLINSQSIQALELFFETVGDELENILPVSYHSLLLLFNFVRDTLTISLDYFPSSSHDVKEPYHFSSIKEMTGYLNGLCLRAIELSDFETNNSRTHQLVVKLQKIIQDHCEQQFTLEFFCDQNNINMSFFSSQFHQISGVTFQEFLNTTRMDNAKKLLRETDNKIGVIAKLCGFSDQHYFSKAFKKHAGCSPREYKSLHVNKLK
jgi:two-component system response regulator YesN